MITLVPYNPTWAVMFSEEKTKIEQTLQGITVHIEHIGSTAIPGIYAKPIIDIMIGVDNINQFSEQDIKKIENLGYRYNPVFEIEFPYRRYFQKNDASGNRSHQLHVVNYPSAWWEKHILFRDYLHAHPQDAKDYESHKLTLAGKFNDTVSYAAAKTEFCRKIDKAAFYHFALNNPIQETERFHAYIPQLACLGDYVSMLENKEFIDCYGVAFSKEQIQERLISDINHWNQYGFGPWMWFDKKNHCHVGRAGIKTFKLNDKSEIELAYAINPQYWRQNVAVEISRAAIDFAFNYLKLDNLICFTRTTNHASLRVMEKLGFEYEKEFTHANLPHKLYRIDSGE